MSNMVRLMKSSVIVLLFLIIASIFSIFFSSMQKTGETTILKEYFEIGSILPLLFPENDRKHSCGWDEDILVGRLPMDLRDVNLDEFANKETFFRNVKAGGHWNPIQCSAKSKVAVIIPFRNRDKHLAILLRYLHPILQKQKLEYRIFVIDQIDDKPFNKGKMMNVGFQHSQKYNDFDCFVFHDVDMIPEDDRNDYGCPSSVRHMAPAINKFKYKLPYRFIFGGVTSFKKEAFIKVNGFANKYYGWGAEDDDMYYRVQRHEFRLVRAPFETGRYTMIKHSQSEKNKMAKQLLDRRSKFIDKDGLSSLRYSVVTTENMTLYTWIGVDSQMTKEEKKLTTAQGSQNSTTERI